MIGNESEYSCCELLEIPPWKNSCVVRTIGGKLEFQKECDYQLQNETRSHYSKCSLMTSVGSRFVRLLL